MFLPYLFLYLFEFVFPFIFISYLYYILSLFSLYSACPYLSLFLNRPLLSGFLAPDFLQTLTVNVFFLETILGADILDIFSLRRLIFIYFYLWFI
jgi:hypothetical protein